MLSDVTLESQLQELFGLANPRLEYLNTLVNDVAVVTTPAGKFVLKLYNVRSRTIEDVQWELDLNEHLAEHGAPVVKPVRGKRGYVETLTVGGQERAAAVFEWAQGEKPGPSHETYALLGAVAARIHSAADTFKPAWMRDVLDAPVLIDEQILRMQRHLEAAKRYDAMVALGGRLKDQISSPALDKGICHIDLTLDNIHVQGGKVTVFDFDSAAYCWRAIEPYGVLLLSADYLEDWLKGYRSIRPFSAADERAVYAFAIIGDIRNIVWKLGAARSSRGKPLMTANDLPKVIDGYLRWEQEHLTGRRSLSDRLGTRS